MEENGQTDEIIRLKWDFIAGMHQTTPANKERYSALKNAVLCYYNCDGEPIDSTETRRYSLFFDGKNVVAKITLHRNLLKIYFPPPESDSKIRETEIKLKNDRALKAALAEIEKIAESRGFRKNPDYKPVDYAEEFPALSNVKFIRREQNSGAELTEPVEMPDVVIEAAELVSCEHVADENGYKPLLRDISLEVSKGDVVGIGGDDDTEIRILCEILGNMRPYYKGYLKLGSVGVHKDKRLLLDHTFYIDNDSMLYGKMTVLEQLLFSVNNHRTEETAIERQRKMLDLLVEEGLGEIALKKIGSLTRGQRIIVALFIAGLSESPIIIANLLEYELLQTEVEMLQKAMTFFKTRGKTVLFATLQPKLIGMTCEKVLFLYNGTIEYYGAVSSLTEAYDKVVCLIKGDAAEEWGKLISARMAGCVCSFEDGTLIVSNYNREKFDIKELYRLFEEYGIKPDMLKLNRGRVENSFRELLVKYDL